MPPIVSFTSDFGLADPYVGTVKAVMLTICPALAIVDVSHEVTPQAIAQAVFLAQQSWPYFPNGTVHLIVVDPGVGTDRAAIAIRTRRGFAVGPDNGVLSAALPDEARAAAAGGRPAPIAVPAGYEVRGIDSPAVVAAQISATFHGRDVFGPAAANLAAGLPFARLGPVRSTLLALPTFRATRADGHVLGEIIHVDRFGNLISSIHGSDLPAGAKSVLVCGREAPLVRTYGKGSGLLALVGSSGYLEVAVTGGSAARALNAGLGLEVRVPVR
jgi:S-adenosylmethionine hydrolase